MKKIFLIAVAAIGMMTASAQQDIQAPRLCDNWSIGLNGGGASPIKRGAFFKNVRGVVGLHIDKQVTPVLGLGIESYFGINTSAWKMLVIPGETLQGGKCVFDHSYVGVYASANLMNLFGGYKCDSSRFFEIRTMAGAGWGRVYGIKNAPAQNWFATKAGLSFDFNITRAFTVSLQPSITFDMGAYGRWNRKASSSACYNADYAAAALQVAATYHFGKRGFSCANVRDDSEIEALNAQINNLRAALEGCQGELVAAAAATAAVQAQLDACLKRPAPQPAEKVVDNSVLESVRYVYYAQSSSTVSAADMRTVDILASYMKSHPNATLDVKGYASPEGNYDYNVKLAAARAEAVKNALVKKGIKANRITAQGEGIGKMFTEESWNRVAICTLK